MGDRPSPRNGRTVTLPGGRQVNIPDITVLELERLMKAQTRETMYAELGMSKLLADSTPSSRKEENGETRPFMELLNQERGSLCMGSYTDDELAVQLFLHGDMTVEQKTAAIMAGEPFSIAYLMAGKERIRWLSRHLDAALGREQELLEEKARALIKLDEQALALDKLQQSLERLEANLAKVAGLDLGDDHSSVELR
jgi:hypothetical protein